MTAGLEVLAIGMVTAVGLDAPSSCAAMRARLDGFQETRYLDPDGEWLLGAPVPLPRPWTGEKRLAHLAAAAIAEALAPVPEARDDAAVILCLAEEGRPGRLPVDDAGFLRRIDEIFALPSRHRPRLVAHGRPSGHFALSQARKLIASRETSFVVIVGVDSYLTTPGVAHYLAENRLLTPENSNGFIPGEAAVAVVCGPPGNGGLRLLGLGLAREPAFIYNPEDLPLRADGMTSAYQAALEETGIAMNRVGYRIADMIGEQYWFKQSALASMRLLRPPWQFQDLWSPSESVGNVGAAVVPLMIGMAFTAAAKGYAAGNPVLVEACNDTGACGAAVLAGGAA